MQDYGLWLLKTGKVGKDSKGQDKEIKLFDVPLNKLIIIDKNLFSAQGMIKDYEVKFDFDEHILKEILILDDSLKFEEINFNKTPQSFNFEKALIIPCITCVLGQNLVGENFIPLVVRKISKDKV
ncbi:MULTISPECIES: hypothetical protein [unclassified Campylobacter]|uniref:hypothetical protein n=1 Tax=unclassified Campylobacter TaxID=2593542 RepID=UPI001237B589|nr:MULTISPECIES: hypothetical protein [unclassified Campylobacter]KAA6226765.1 hypothetical protein FMM55_04265 [Campylobacter sp. LR196d]KAA6229042.1 hypothetical protein FMM57_01410 [Campylobacter sp. LR286c]KAA6230202.1 hypothetical protein FMM58_05895 [Campylobacter sp. LR291e]KAA6233723.1 hypothetical protein FMM56_02110 [Campylobacter sp. LR264d]